MNWAVLALLAAHDAAAAAGDVATAHAYLNGASNSTARNIMGKSLYFFFSLLLFFLFNLPYGN